MPKKFNLQNPAENFYGGRSRAPAPSPEPAPAERREPVAEAGAGTVGDAGSRQAPSGYKVDRRFVETKSKHCQLLMQPSLHRRVKAVADKEGVSVNEMISRLLLDALERMEG